MPTCLVSVLATQQYEVGSFDIGVLGSPMSTSEELRRCEDIPSANS